MSLGESKVKKEGIGILQVFGGLPFLFRGLQGLNLRLRLLPSPTFYVPTAFEHGWLQQLSLPS